jgi:WhiB family transcriptional regulator, redox-sensing transcriptional regulator
MQYAACAGSDTELFFPGDGQAASKSKVQAKKICAECFVSNDCLDYALKRTRRGDRIVGIWGGLGDQERKNLLKRQDEEARLRAAKLLKEPGT